MNKIILNDIINIISGGTPQTSIKEYWENGTIGWLSVTDFNDDNRYVYESEKKITELGVSKSNTKYLQKGDIIISARGTVGALAQIGKPMCFNQSCFGIRGKNNIVDTDFLYYALKNYVKNIVKRSQGSVFDTINLASFNLMELEIPISIHYQTKITKVLSDLDAKIELNNKINKELEAMAKLLYDYWFVQFDFPDKNGKPYKSSGGKMVWNEALNRKIPKGWEVKELGKILNTDLGGTPSTIINKFWGGNIPWLNSGEIANFPIVEAEEHITNEAILNSATTLMPSGTCVLSITRHLRPSILAINACANQSVVGIFESEKYKYSYIYPYLKNEIPRLMTLRSGAQQPHINKGIVDESLMIEPSSEILEEYYKKVNPAYAQIINNSFQNQQLTELRDWLLPMLMNGQVTVGEAAAQLGMVAEDDIKYGKE